MVIKTIEINQFVCNRCGFVWLAGNFGNILNRKYKPKKCAKCMMSTWNSEVPEIKLHQKSLALSEEDIEMIQKENRKGKR